MGAVAVGLVLGGTDVGATALAAGPRPVTAAVVASSDDPDSLPEVVKDRECGKTKGYLWIGGMTIMSMLPGASILSPLGFASALGTIGYYGTCVLGVNEAATLVLMIKDMERAAGAIGDQQALQSVYARSTDLMRTLERERPNLAKVDTMTSAERAGFAIVMQTIGNSASLLEAELENLPWQALPAVAVIGAVKNGAYALSYLLTPPGQNKNHLLNVVMPAEVEETRQLMATHEAQYTRFVTDEVSVRRESRSAHTSTILARASRGTGGFVYSKDWTCTKSFFGKGCDLFTQRRTEFFAAALGKHREVRGGIAELLGDEYLQFKNELDMYRGKPFFVINNRSQRTGTTVASIRYTCLDVKGSPGKAAGTPVQLADCQFAQAGTSGAPSTDQVWHFVQGTGRLQNVLSGRCLDVAGPASQQAEGSNVVLSDCVAGNSPEHADQQWGMHPLGYLVNLSSGRCLDMTGAATIDNGALARVTTCEYASSPMPRPVFPFAGGVKGYDNFNGYEGIGTSTGIDGGDPATDQSWSLGYVGVRTGPLASQGIGRDRVLPAPPPPYDPADTVVPEVIVDTTPPELAISDLVQREGTTSAVVEYSVDETAQRVECRVDDEEFVPCSSGYETAPLAHGEHRLTVRAVDEAGNAASDQATVVIDAAAPVTTIVSGPSGTTTTVDAAVFRFASSKSASTFACRLDEGAFAPCTSPTDHGRLAAGTHTFEVRATNNHNGLADQAGAKRTWTVRVCLLAFPGQPCLL